MRRRGPILAIAFAGIAVSAAGRVAPWAAPWPFQPQTTTPVNPDDLAAKTRARELADSLLFEGATAEQRVLVEAAMREGPASLLGAEVLGRMSDGRPVPGWVIDGAIAASGQWPEADAKSMARALSGARTLSAARALTAMGERFKTAAARNIIFEAFIDLTGRDDLKPQDPAALSAILKAMDGWTDERWFRTISGWQSDRARRLAQEQQQTSSKLLETLRQVHLSTPATERSRLIATLLNDQLLEVRRLGIDLALRELASANPLGPAVASGAIRLVSDTDESVRAAAAGLLLQLSPAGSAEIALAALGRERSPKVATPLLKLVVRSNDPGAVAQAIAWVEAPAGSVAATPEVVRACRDAAVDLAWQLTRRGLINDEADRLRILTALRQIPLAELSVGGCQLRGLIGTGMDVDQVATLITSQDATQRLAAAETVVGYGEHLDAILQAARTDSRLVDVAVRGVLLHRQTAAGFVAIERATADKPELRRAALTAVADVLPATEVLVSIESLANEPAMKEPVLATLSRRERISSERVDRAQARAIADGLARLARLRLKLGKPAEAIAALDMLTEVGVGGEEPEVLRLRASAFIRLGRIADARQCNSDPEGWLDGLAAVIDKPFAREVEEEIQSTVVSNMNEEQLATLELLRRRLPPKRSLIADEPLEEPEPQPAPQPAPR